MRSPQQAQRLGISTVYQEVNLCRNLSMAENILIGREPRRWGRIDWPAMNRRASDILHDLDIDVDVTQPLGSYSVAIQQMAAIARALEISSAKVLILDEPTSSLDAHETEQLFAVMRKLRRTAGSRSSSSPTSSTRSTRSRIGSPCSATGGSSGPIDAAEPARFELIAKMLGRNLTELDDMTKDQARRQARTTAGDAKLTATGLGRDGSIEPFDLELRAGEVVGLAGLLGFGPDRDGRRCCSASTSRTAGSLTVDGKRGDALLPDRHRSGAAWRSARRTARRRASSTT